MATILELAHEVLHHIFTQVEPADLAAISATCKALNNYVTNNHLLFKEHYLQFLDEPVVESLNSDPDYISDLKTTVKLQKLLESDNDEIKREYLPFISAITSLLLAHANPDHLVSLNVDLLNSYFKTPENTVAILSNSTTFSRATDTPPIAKASQQLSAKLHSLYGTSIDHLGRRCSSATFPYARSMVYDIRNYTNNNLWGPYLDERDVDGRYGLRVDWEKVEAIMVVLGYNMRHFSEHHGVDIVWDTPFAGTYGCTVQASRRWRESGCKLFKQPDVHVKDLDPYNITGTWRRVVCFLDYNDFYAFNFREIDEDIPRSQPREPIHREEAIRLITMKLHAAKIEAPGEGDNPALPVVHFRGTRSSHSMHPSWDPNANSAIRGTVRLTKEGEVRWTTLSIFDGEVRWKSEGVQVGGARSGRGVIGTWFDKNYDPQGPCGPTAFWKLSDQIEEDKPRQVTAFGYISL